MSEPRVPVTLLTGFLGVGKTTLLNNVLTHPDTGRVAVVVNEFGDAGLDHEIIEVTPEDITLLSSGCICCSLRGDLVEAIPNLLTRRERGELEFDRIVIETTGLADPSPIQRTLIMEPSLAKLIKLDGIVTLVDAVNGAKTLDAHFEAVSQATMADLIVLTKTDIAETAQIQHLRARLERLNAARIIEVDEAVAQPALLWACSAIKQDAPQADVLTWLTPKPDTAKGDPFANLSGFAPSAPANVAVLSVHEGRIESASLVVDKPLDRQRLGIWLSDLIMGQGENILRVKGILFFKGEDTPTVFHCVQHTIEPPVQLKTWYGGDRRSKIVIIARDMSSSRLQSLLSAIETT
ncbi:CobW family GTP-binding protein [Falsiruegeria mediterranea]|uniref:Putative GTP-binding protein YjiA n=1 Tax=Falsiruegeria mediterranea M17 TaxID=1200281 RepID=A0A2R8C8N2_9RHOB|nr:GTP-binding protein [Falsiruegeria mediterranea]SPJ28726.1 putative GTP-binding protein YjiA [Falsiruegeria mediterranea M17]